MINEETNLVADDDVLHPAEVAATDSGKAQHAGIEIPIGHVLIVALDANGTEIPGSEFFYPERTYPRFYGDDTTMEFNIINIVPRVNQSGTASGTVRGIYINPNLISAPDFRAVVIANNSGYGIYQGGAATKNYFNGSVGIRVVNPVEALEVGGNIKTAAPSASGAGVIKIGKVITGATVTVQTDRYLEVEIDGVIRKLAIVN